MQLTPHSSHVACSHVSLSSAHPVYHCFGHPAILAPPLPPSSLLTTLRFLFPAAILFVADFGHSLLPFIRLPSAHTLCIGLACSAFCLCKNKSFICCPETVVTSGLSQCQHLIANKWKSPATSPAILCLGWEGLTPLSLHCGTGEMLVIYSSVCQSAIQPSAI